MPLFVCATLVSSTSPWTRGKGPRASLGGCRAQHPALLRRIRDVQRGSPPQADAEGLVVDSPQDEGCPGRVHAPLPTFAAPVQRNAAGVWGVPRISNLPPRSKIRLRRNGGQEVDDHRLERGPSGFRGHDRAWPSEDWFRIPAPRFHEDGLRGNDRREAQDTSGPRLGCPQIEIIPPRWNTRLRRMPRVWGCPPIL
jgi:hypothetical protein